MKSLIVILAMMCSLPVAEARVLVAVRAPFAEGQRWPNADAPTTHSMDGADLVRITLDESNQVVEEVVLDATDPPATIIDPQTDGKWVFYAKRNRRVRLGRLAEWGFDIFKIPVAGGTPTQLTFGEWQPPESVPYGRTPTDSPRRNRAGFFQSIIPHNTGPCLIGPNQVIFTSTRDGYRINGARRGGHGAVNDAFLIYTMDRDGKNLECIANWTLGSALHPEIHPRGTFIISEKENMAGRGQRSWGLTEFNRDGTNLTPAVSSYTSNAYHFHAAYGKTSDGPADGRLGFINYYTPRNGTGTLIGVQLDPFHDGAPAPRFHSPFTEVSGAVGGYVSMQRSVFRQEFMNQGSHCVTEFAHHADMDSPLDAAGVHQGAVTMPSPGTDGMIIVWTGPSQGWRGRGRIMLIPDYKPVRHPSEMVTLVDNPQYSYIQPREVASHEEIFGKEIPLKPWIANDGSVKPDVLPAGTPFALVGWGSVINREWLQWTPKGRGGMLKDVADDEIHTLVIYATRPSPHLGGRLEIADPRCGWECSQNERFEILAEIPLRDGREGMVDGLGNPDTSGWFLIPGDTAYTFGVKNARGEQVAFARKWHGHRPGEVRWCGDCHVHTQFGTPPESTLAWKWFQGEAAGASFELPKALKPRVLEYLRDIHPIVERYGLDVRVSYEPKHWYEPALGEMYNVRPHGSSVSPLIQTLPDEVSPEDRKKLIDWIDMGAPVGSGILMDDLKPVLTVQSPNREQFTPIDVLRFGAYDLHGEIVDIDVRASFPVQGRKPGANLADLFTVSNHVWTLPIPLTTSGDVAVQVKDRSGNTSRIVRTFDAARSD